MLVDHIISGIYNSGIWEVILIGDNTTLLDYGHRFNYGLEHLVSHCNIHKVIEWRWLSVVGCWVNFKFYYEGASTPMCPSGPHSELIFLDDMIYDGWMGF